jgi:hypothetical protein
MCWNPEVSLSTYLFSATPLFILTFLYNDIPLLIFLAMHSWISMQLIEFFLWKNLHNPQMNYFFSVVGFIAIMAQPFFFILSMTEFKYRNHVLFLYLFSVAMYCISNKIIFETTVAKNGHLLWKWIDVPIHNALLWLAFLCFRPFYLYVIDPSKNKHELFCLVAILIGAGVSYATFIQSKTWGSMWCWLANIISLRYYYLLYKKY